MGRTLNTTGGLDRMTAGQTMPPPAPPAEAQHAATPPAPEAQHAATPPATPATPAPEAAPSPFAGARTEVGAEPDVYHPGGDYSLVRDVFHAKVDNDTDAAERLTRYRRQLEAFQADAARFVETRADAPQIIPPGYRGDLLLEPEDTGRPLWALLTSRGAITVPLADATPFKIPSRGKFTGVGDHVEGTAHVPAGTLELGDDTITPKAISGAFEVSRELVDSSNPAIDRIAISAMREDYEDQTEAYAYARMTAGLEAVPGIDTGPELEAELLRFFRDRKRPADFGVAGSTYYEARATEQAGDGRPRYPVINPMNANGQAGAGFESLSIAGKPFVMDEAGGVDAANTAAIVKAGDVLLGESSLLTFRFDEVLGPGVIKLALWAYVAGARLRANGVRLVTAAEPAPAG